ncbi:uncharacterized protein LOC127086434 [Lathyrus oleraceus]|uniref:uncharacterized protein LOC127086434 n=1 Tax=Pisum sativum TaxID=3888 RepID=UPI0021D33032|nr:uncharacterized protein LOC127086434 [Pisum sativum]
MDYSSSDETQENECYTIEGKRKRKSIGASMMARLTKVHNNDGKLTTEFNDKTSTCYGMNSSLFRSYVVFLGRGKMNILIDDLTQVSVDLKESIWTNIKDFLIDMATQDSFVP